MKKFLLILPSLFFLLSCNNNSEKDCYEIYNSVLKEKVSTYGIMANYLFSKNHPKKDFAIIVKKVSDSLKDSKSLTYYLEDKLTILDTLNPNDTFLNDGITVESRPKYSKNKIDFSKIEKLPFAKRLKSRIPIDENQKKPTFLGNYDLSEPIFISKNKAVIKFQHYCGGKCGVGILIYLKKEDDHWKIIKEKKIWIS